MAKLGADWVKAGESRAGEPGFEGLRQDGLRQDGLRRDGTVVATPMGDGPKADEAATAGTSSRPRRPVAPRMAMRKGCLRMKESVPK
jgi:hypothetical protein